MNNSFSEVDQDQSPVKIHDHDEVKDAGSPSTVQFHGLKTDGESAFFYKNGNSEAQEDGALMIPENEEELRKSRETEIEAGKEKEEMRDKLNKNTLVLKAVSILLVCLLLWNFVLVVIVMSFMSSSSSNPNPTPNPIPTPDFSALLNLTQENREILQQLQRDFENLQRNEKFKFDEMTRKINSTEEKLEALRNPTEEKFEDWKNSTERMLENSRNSTEVKFESLINSTHTKLETSIHFAQELLESWRNRTKAKFENWTTFTEEKLENWISVTEEKMESFYVQLDLQNDTLADLAEQAEKLTEAEGKWSDAKTELATEISENTNLIRNLENRTNQMDFNAQDLRRKVEPLLRKFAANLGVCGGAVSISEMVTLQYFPHSNSTSSPCAWLVWSTTMTQIKMKLNDLEKGELTIYQSFDTSESWTSSFKRTRGNLFQESIISSNIVLLVFTPPSSSSSSSRSPVSGFEVEFTRGSAISGSALVPTMSDVNPAVRKQLPSSNGYSDNDRRFYIVYPPPGQKVNLTMESIDTEANHDTVRIYKFGTSTTPQNFQLVQTYSGTTTIGQSFEGGNSQPILLYFSTDTSVTKTGFRASIVTV